MKETSMQLGLVGIDVPIGVVVLCESLQRTYKC
jgi:hypothetical protein